MTRNANRKRSKATATLFLLLGTAFLAAAPAGALDVTGWATGQASGGADAALDGVGDGSADSAGGMGGALAGSADAAADAAADASADGSANADGALDAVGDAEAGASGVAQGAAQHSEAANGRADADWGITGSDGAYDVTVGGRYAGGPLDVGKKHTLSVDAQGHRAMAANAAASAEGSANGLLDQLEAAINNLAARVYLNLDGAAKALGAFGVEVSGLLNLHGSESKDLAKGLSIDETLAPKVALPRAHADIPEIPDLAVDRQGNLYAEGAAEAAAHAVGGVEP